VPVDGVAHAIVSCVFQVSFTGPSLFCACTRCSCRQSLTCLLLRCVQPPSTALQPLPMPSAPFNVPAKDGVYLVHATADYTHSLSIGQLMRHAAAVFAKCATPSLNAPHASRSTAQLLLPASNLL
jgi:hypothetical protein